MCHRFIDSRVTVEAAGESQVMTKNKFQQSDANRPDIGVVTTVAS